MVADLAFGEFGKVLVSTEIAIVAAVRGSQKHTVIIGSTHLSRPFGFLSRNEDQVALLAKPSCGEGVFFQNL